MKTRQVQKSNVIPFPTNLGEFRRNNPTPKPITTYVKTSVQETGLVTVSVNGDSLKDFGIDDGDTLVCQTAFEKSEVKNGKLVVVQLPKLGMVVKFYFKFEGKVILRSANPRYEDLIFDKELVEVKAIVIQSVKDWN